ncbi:hypothetical protein Unana1_00176 [Umbelopsis nana]
MLSSYNKLTIYKPPEVHECYRWTTDQILDKLTAETSVDGKAFIVTGSRYGLGEETAPALSTRGAVVVITSRGEKAAQQAIKRIQRKHPAANLRWLKLVLSDLASVQDFANQGYESQFGVNHLSHFLLIQVLIDNLAKTGSGVRVVIVSSQGHRFAGVQFDDVGFQGGKSYGAWVAYGQSKTAEHPVRQNHE